ncbi:MAG: exodeoxyribonuclease V subunit beta [Planctomycetota bacterium]|nr:exodeoxyribonuclease V subunit beta [Planctomycetota bacterium]
MFDPLQMPLSGVHSIAASAGTGKTFTITTLYLRLLLEGGCSADQILVTTFTEAATSELRDRLRSRLNDALQLLRSYSEQADAEIAGRTGGADRQLVKLLQQGGAWAEDSASRAVERLEDALLSFDQAPVFTIHGFCSRVLQELVFESGTRFNVELVASLDEHIQEGIGDFVARSWTTRDSLIERWLPLTGSLYAKIQKVVNTALNNPSLAIVPDGDELDDLLHSDFLTSADRLLDQLTKVWHEQRAAVRDLIDRAVEDGVLKKPSYGKSELIDKSMAFIDSLVDSRSLADFTWKKDKLDGDQNRLTQGGLESGTMAKFRGSTPEHPAFGLLQEIADLSQEFSRRQQEVESCMLARAGLFVRDHAAKRRGECGIMSFGDLLSKVDEALDGRQKDLLLEGLREKYRVALVDEFQDTDPVQYRIFSRVFREAAEVPDPEVDRAFIMIGDPKQSIYRFRGADLAAYLEAEEQTPAEHRHNMGTNWRSDRSLVNSVQAVFDSVSNPFLNKRIPLPEVDAHHDDRFRPGAAFCVSLIPRPEYQEPDKAMSRTAALEATMQRLVENIVTQLKSDDEICMSDGTWRRLEPSDIAVLCKTGRELRTIQQALADRGVASVLQTDESVFESVEAVAVLHVLRAVNNTTSLTRQFNALQTPVFGQNAAQLDSLRDDSDRLSHFVERLQEWHALWQRDGFIVMWRRLLGDEDTIARLAGEITGERQITNYLHLGELLHRQATTSHSGPDELLRWFEQTLSQGSTGDEEALLRLETDSAAVQLCTIHKSKGLEYSIVYCPALWSVRKWEDPTVVMSRSGKNGETLPVPQIDVGSELLSARQGQDQQESEAEERRLLYVALTRAKHQCHIYWTAAANSGNSALGQILLGDLPENASDIELECRLREWVDGFGLDRVHVRSAGELARRVTNARYERQQHSEQELAARPVRRRIISAVSQTSFTALVSSTYGRLIDDVADHDSFSALRHSDTESLDGTTETVHVPLATMPGGRLVGDVVHAVLERALNSGKVFEASRENVLHQLTELLKPGMERMQLEPRWLSPLAATLTTCLVESLPVGDDRCCLTSIPSHRFATELPFLLRLGGAAEFSTQKVADAFASATDPLLKDYARRVRAMSVFGLQGFLAGFVDLVFESNGKWFVADYKTNFLGPAFSDYSRERLDAAMFEHDYLLQASLYSVAVCRLLEQRLLEFDLARDFGGVVYLFLRGFPTDGPPQVGVWHHCPEAAFVKALSDALDGGTAE